MLDKLFCYCMKRTSSTCGTRVGTRKRESLKTYPRASGAEALAPQRTWKECKIRKALALHAQNERKIARQLTILQINI